MVEPSPSAMGYVAPPSPADLGRFLGWPPLDQEQQEAAQAHLSRAVLLVGAYVRGRGFMGDTMAPALAQVVLSLAARTMNNPTGDSRVTAGQFASSPGQPDFSLVERLILDGHRRRVA